jgi:protein SCO1|tara:strand:- start:80328 stop:80960 length:633 start_codon:yes stop_codon:yes gene_type:complete
MKNFLTLLIITFSCEQSKINNLPIYGRKVITETIIDEKIKIDTSDHTISNFSFINQNGEVVNNSTFNNSIYIADFFFTSCPTICPLMKSEMMRVYKKYENEENVKFLSHTINPNYDNVERLKEYSKKFNINSNKWHFVTGDINEIYEIGFKSYMVISSEDSLSPGGFLHSGAFLLVDKNRKIRGVYDGTNKVDINKLIDEIPILLNENSE